MFPIPWNKLFRKKDGSLTTIDEAIAEGGGDPYTLPTASAETKGGVKIGSGLAMEGEVLNNSNPTPYVLPTASAETLGGIKVGSGLSINDGVLSATGGSSNKYLHVVYIDSQYSTGKGLFLSNSNTAFTVETLAQWLYDNNFKDSANTKNERYPLMVQVNGTTSGTSICSPNGTDIKIYTMDGSAHTDTQYYTLYDIVVTI